MVKSHVKHLKNLRCGYCRKFIKCSEYKAHIILEHLEQEKEKYANSTQVSSLTCPICNVEMLEFRFFNHLLLLCDSNLYMKVNHLAKSLNLTNERASFNCFICHTKINADVHEFYIHFIKKHNRFPNQSEIRKYIMYWKKKLTPLPSETDSDKDWYKPWYEVSGGKCSPR